jgi:hypothetical protein
MPSNAERGARAKGRTKKWLEARGYQVADLEKVHWIFMPSGNRIPTKKDQMASDLLAVATRNVEPYAITTGQDALVLFVQVKSGKSASGGTFPDARRKFAAYTWPSCTTQVVIAWPPRARHPRIVVM